MTATLTTPPHALIFPAPLMVKVGAAAPWVVVPAEAIGDTIVTGTVVTEMAPVFVG